MKFALLFLIFCGCAFAQSKCPSSNAPTDLAAVSVWYKRNGSTPIFRISDEDIGSEGFARSFKDRDNFVVLLARSEGGCGEDCSVKLSTLRRKSDGMIDHQETRVGLQLSGFEDLKDDFYCGRTMGACGADMPIYKYTNLSNTGAIQFAYSVDPAATFPGMHRDLSFQCFGWADGGSVLHPVTTEHQCMRIASVDNARISYSNPGSGAFPVGTSATLTCDPNFAVTGQNLVVCTQDGWSPRAGLGHCVDQKTHHAVVNSAAAFAGSSAVHNSAGSSECLEVPKVEHAQMLYSHPARNGHHPNRSTLSILCDLGYVAAHDTSAVCVNGTWNEKKLATCEAPSAVKCPPHLPVYNGKIIYNGNSTANPYGDDAVSELKCDPGFIIKGSGKAICQGNRWGNPLGTCEKSDEETHIREKRQGLSCAAVLPVVNGLVSYIQASASQPYATGTTATLACNLGFNPSGSAQSTCQSGLWISAIGACAQSTLTGLPGVAPGIGGVNTGSAGLQCADMLQPANGNVAYSSQGIGLHPSLSTASLTCKAGYVVRGALSATCSNGVWSPSTLGSCDVSSLSNPFAPTSSNALECGNAVVYNGVISYSGGNLDATKPVSTVATLTCNPGTTLNGIDRATCLNGAWSPPLGTCTGTATGIAQPQPVAPGLPGLLVPAVAGSTPCFGMFPPLFGTLSYSATNPSSTFNSGTTVSLTCNPGTPSGPTSATCNSGAWVPPSLGTCNPTVVAKAEGVSTVVASSGSGAQCFGALPPLGGTIEYSSGGPFGPFGDGVRATLKCIGTNIQGTSQSTCTDGKWVPPLGTCTFGIVQADAISTPQPLIGGVTGAACPFAPPIPFGITAAYSGGSQFGPFNSGSTVTITCPSGQTISGTPTATCQNGSWTTLGTCSIGGIGSNLTNPFTFGPLPPLPPLPPFVITQNCMFGPFIYPGSITYSNGALYGPFQNGTIAQPTCPNGGTVQGNARATCISGTFTPPLGSCPSSSSWIPDFSWLPGLTSCQFGVLPPYMGTITYSNAALYGPFPNGTVATLTCASGYVIQGGTTAVCNNTSFAPQLGSCSRVSGVGDENCLSAPTTPNGGVFRFSTGSQTPPFPSGTTLTLNCTNGFAPNGVAMATCNAGTFTPQIGTCSGNNTSGTPCITALPLPMNGNISYSTGTNFGPFAAGTRATLLCSIGTVQGETVSTCNNGIFTPTLGTCVGTTVNNITAQCVTPPPLPTQGTFSYSNGLSFPPFSQGTVVTLACGFGSSVQGQSTATCINGQWTPMLGTCQTGGISTGNITCPGAPAAPFLGTLQYPRGNAFGPFNSGEQITLTCLSGTVQGATTAVCTNGQFIPPLGTCGGTGGNTAQCPFAPTTPSIGTLTYSTGLAIPPFNQGTTVTLTCPFGNTLQGSATMVCTNGQWNGTLGTCGGTGGNNAQCPFAPLTPSIGTLTYSTGLAIPPFNQGTTVTLTCPFGNTLQGSATMVCTNGQWNGTLGTCGGTGGNNAQCPFAPLTPSIGTLTYSTGLAIPPFNQGTTVTLTCPFGNTLQGSATMVCTNGQWNGTLGTCGGTGGNNAQCPFAPFTPSIGTLTYSTGLAIPPFTQGTTVTLTCPFGNTLQGSATMVCTNGQWSGTLGTCGGTGGNNAQCPFAPLTPSIGTLTYSTGLAIPPFNQGTTVTLTCPFGNTLQGSATMVCTNGQWNGTLGTCGGTGGNNAQCPFAPLTPSIGTLTYSTGLAIPPFNQGTTVTLTCPFGNTLQGSATMVCTNGQWNGTLGTCGGTGGNNAQCPFAPLTPSIGTLTYSTGLAIPPFNQGTTVTLTCPFRNTLQGSATMICTNGQWTGTLGTCGGTGGTNLGGTTCSNAPTPPMFGTLQYPRGSPIGPFNNGEQITLICSSGYSVSGNSTATCTNGQFTGLGTCILGGGGTGVTTSPNGPPCPFPPAAPAFGMLNFPNGKTFGPFDSGTVVRLNCNLGYTMQGGNSTVTCLNGQFQGTFGTCVPGIGNLDLQNSVNSLNNGINAGLNNLTNGFNNGLNSGINTINNLITCLFPPLIPFNGVAKYSGSAIPPFTSGSTITLSCNTGAAEGPTVSTCTGGQFTPALGRCV